MDAGKGNSCDFMLSQALADPVVRKGVCCDFILCGLSPPVSPWREMVSQYTFGPDVEDSGFEAVSLLSKAAQW